MNDIAARQFDGASAFQQAQAAQSALRFVHQFGGFVAVMALLAIWWGPILRTWKSCAKEPGNPSGPSTAALWLATIVFGSAVLIGSMSPAFAYRSKSDWAEYYNAAADETVILIPMLGDKASQSQMRSVEFFQTNKVAAQYVLIPHGKLPGTGNFFDEFVNTSQVIVVKRRPVAREWTASASTGTSRHDESFSCESSESHNIRASLTFAAMIEESNAAKYLYFAGSDPTKKLATSQSGGDNDKDPTFVSAIPALSLETFTDTFARRIIQAALCDEMGRRTTDEVIKQKADIMKAVRKVAEDQLGAMGVTIKALGYAGALDLDDHIQKAINDVYVAGKRRDAALAMKDAIPALTEQARIEMMLGFAEALKSGKLPNLPSFVGAIPPEVLDAFKHYATGATVLGVPFTNPSK
jgi:hypothetical protein